MNSRTKVSPDSGRFVAPTAREALRLARENLGPDAIVLSNRVIADGVEILAKVSPSLGVATDSFADAMVRKVHSIRGLLEDQLYDRTWNEAQKRDPLRGHLLRILLGAGFSARLSKDLLLNMPARHSLASGVDYVKSALANRLPMLESEDVLMEEGGVYALTGPTGVGKTTTTAKLAARCVMRFGPEKLALVTTDSYRVGAYEQLRIYGQILGVSVHAVKDAADLELVLSDLQDKHMVLIDTVGMSQRDRAVSDQIALLCGSSRPVKRLLLLNASSHGDTLNEVVQSYRQSELAGAGKDLAGCIFTKVDEATHPGVMIDMAIRHQLPVYYVSNGQKVPEHLTLGDRSSLIDSVFQTSGRSALFVAAESNPEQWMAALNNEADVAAAEVLSKRLRSQCHQLIAALVHNVEEISATKRTLAAGLVGFNETESLQHLLADDQISPEEVAHNLLTQACADSRINCRDHVLSVASELSPTRYAGVESPKLVSTLLLSDRSGLPFAAPNPLLASPALPGIEAHGWTQLPKFAKPLVHLLADIPALRQRQEWKIAGAQWAASAKASLRVVSAGGCTTETLVKLAAGLTYSAPKPLLHLNKKAWSSVAQALVSLCTEPKNSAAGGASSSVPLRCVIRRIIDANTGKLLAQTYVLASTGIQATALQISQWPVWRAAAEPYFKLLRQGSVQFVADAPADDVSMRKRLLVMGQLASTVFRLQRSQASWAPSARKVLAQLAGRVVRPDRPVPGAVLLEGLGKFLVLLDALETEDAPADQPFDMVAAQD